MKEPINLTRKNSLIKPVVLVHKISILHNIEISLQPYKN